MNPQTPGYKTTEFWMTILAVAIGMLAVAGVFEDGSRWSQILGFIQTSLVTAGYTIARGLTKSGVAKASSAVEVARLQSGSYATAPIGSYALEADRQALAHAVAAVGKEGYSVMPQAPGSEIPNPTRPLNRP